MQAKPLQAQTRSLHLTGIPHPNHPKTPIPQSVQWSEAQLTSFEPPYPHSPNLRVRLDYRINYPAASCRVSKTHHANASHSVTPECFSPGSRIRIGLDSRLKYAGMTDFGLAVAKTQQAAGMNPKRLNLLCIARLICLVRHLLRERQWIMCHRDVVPLHSLSKNPLFSSSSR
jgi:hypothetical protein